MAISANSVFEVRTGGADTNGGGFVTGASGTDYSLQNGSNTTGNNISTTDAKSNNTTTITSASASFTAALVGNIVYFQGGTGAIAAVWRQVTSVPNGTSIVIDTAIASSTAMTMNIGGALASPGQASGIAIAGNVVFVLNVGADGASVYSISSATANIAGGVLGNANAVFFQGYTSSRTLGNTDARPQLQLNVSTATLISGASASVQNFVLNGNAQTAAKLVSSSARINYCLIENFNTASTSTPSFYGCSATTNSAGVFIGTCVSCEAYANTATPFIGTGVTSYFVNCIASGNTGATTDGFGSSFPNCYNCVSISNGRYGFNATQGGFFNCHAESNSGYGFNLTTTGNVLINCAAYGNTSGDMPTNTHPMSNVGFISVTAGSVFVNAAGFNFVLNNTANHGALLRAAADPATFPRGLTANYRDIGAAQHQDSPSTTTTNIFIIDD